MGVVLVHCGWSFAVDAGFPVVITNLLSHGGLGVPFFFILSGFILAYVYGNTGLSFGTSRDFYISRIARIYPVFLLSILIAAPFAAAASPALEWQQFVMLQSWSEKFQHWNGPAWTLSVEAFFYLLFPLFLPILNRMGIQTLLAVAVFSMFLFILLVCFGFHQLFPPARLPEFIYGVALGLVFLRGARTHPAVFVICAITATATLAMPNSMFTKLFSVITFGPLIFAGAGVHPDGIVGKALHGRLLVFLGGASYSIYLLHIPVKSIIETALPASLEMFGKAIYIPVLLLVSCLVFQFFEEPARQLIRRRLLSRKHAQQPWITKDAMAESEPRLPAA